LFLAGAFLVFKKGILEYAHEHVNGRRMALRRYEFQISLSQSGGIPCYLINRINSFETY